MSANDKDYTRQTIPTKWNHWWEWWSQQGFEWGFNDRLAKMEYDDKYALFHASENPKASLGGSRQAKMAFKDGYELGYFSNERILKKEYVKPA